MRLTLFKKNLAAGYSGGSLLFISIAFIMSLLDWHYSFSAETWYLITMGLWISSFSLGGICFECDLARDNIRFLEYLPVRRSHIWLANYADGLYSVIFSVVAAGWHRTLWFTPGGTAITDEFSTLFPTRWSFFLGAGASAFWFFSITIFFRTFFKRASFGLTIAGAAVIALIALRTVTVETLLLTPSWIELAPIFFLSGLLFSLGSFLIFVLVPSYKPQWVRVMLVGMPLVACIAIIGLAHLYYEWLRWKEISPDETLQIASVAVPSDPKGTLVAVVNSKRSAFHTISIDLQTGDFCDLGRNLDWSLVKERGKVSVGKTGLFSFISSRATNGLFPDRRYLVTISPQGDDIHRILPATSPSQNHPGEQRYWANRDFQWTTNGEQVVFWQEDYDPDSERAIRSLVDADRNGTIRHRLAADDFLMSESGLVLCTEPSEEKSTSERSHVHPAYILLDINSGKETRFQLHGRSLGFSTDLKSAAIIRGRVEENRVYQSVVLVDLVTQQEKTLVAENEIPPVIFGNKGDAENWLDSQYYPDLRTFALNFERLDRDYYWIDPIVVFDVAFTRMVWMKQERNGEFFDCSLVSIDLKTGERRVLLPTTELPKLNIGASAFAQRDFNVHGFSTDGNKLLYDLHGDILSMDIPTGERQTLWRLTPVREKNGSDEVKLSPNSHRVYRELINDKKIAPADRKLVRAEDWYESTIEIFENGNARPIYSRPCRFESFWLDDAQILVNEGDRITLVQADGSGNRQIFLHKRSIDAKR